jgi:DNA-binding NarL/FixJ family response regulator
METNGRLLGNGPQADDPAPDVPGSNLRVAIVADVRLFRDGLAELIGRADGVEVVAQVRSVDALRIDSTLPQPDVVLWDVATQNGVGAIRDFAASAPGVSVLVLSVEELEPEVVRLAEAGMAGCVTREADVAELIRAIRSAAAGEFPCSPRVAGTLLRHVGALAQRQRAVAASSLTPRELEIVRLIGRGLTNKEIASELTVELSTVKNHIHNALEKLGVHRRSEAVARVSAGPTAEPSVRDPSTAGRPWV